MDWRMASARPMDLVAARRLIAPVMSFTVAVEFDFPMRDEQRPRLRIDEGAREARECLGALRATGSRVAGGEDHPIRVELQPRDLGRGKVAVVLLGGRSRRRQQQARLGIALNLASQRAMRREMHDAVLRKLARFAQAFHLALGGALAKPEFAHIGVQVARHGA